MEMELELNLIDLIDADTLSTIEQAFCDMTEMAAGISDQHGTPITAHCNTSAFCRLIKSAKNQIISVGGGLPLRAGNRELLHELGQVFYLRAEAETIYGRLKGDTTRPLLQGSDPEEKIRKIGRAHV